MTRSFTDRVFGGVCGGLANRLPFNVWVVRWLFVLGAIVTLGLMVIIYGLLWMLVPQESLIIPKRLGFFRFIVIVIAISLCTLAWWAIFTQAYTPLLSQIPAGISDFITRASPIILVVIGLGLLFRQRIPLANIASLVISIALVGGIATIAYNNQSAQLSTAQTVSLDHPIPDGITRLVVNVAGRTTDITIASAPDLTSIIGQFIGSRRSIITITENLFEQGDGELIIAETLSPDFPRLDDLGRSTIELNVPSDMPLVLNVANLAGDVTLSLGNTKLERLTLDIRQGDGVVALPNYNPISLRSEEIPHQVVVANGDLTLLIPEVVDARVIYRASNLAEVPPSYIEAREGGLTILRPNPDTFPYSNAPRLFYEVNVGGGAFRIQLREDS